VTLTTNNGKKQTSFATTGVGDMRMSSTATLTAGTRTLDAAFTSQILYQVTTTANQVMLPSANGDLWNSDTGGGSVYPLVFAANEGFIINATVPATGTWNGVVVVEWCELASFP
jgi:hypothetical protein